MLPLLGSDLRPGYSLPGLLASNYDGNGRCCLLHRHDGLLPRRDNHIDFKVYKLDGDVRITLNASFPPSVLDRNVATINPTEFAQLL